MSQFQTKKDKRQTSQTKPNQTKSNRKEREGSKVVDIVLGERGEEGKRREEKGEGEKIHISLLIARRDRGNIMTMG